MPRDKTASHEKIVAAAMEEFLQKGYAQASMKAVADAVGMTSAGLYRHFASKQDMFAAMVQPAIDALDFWIEKHVALSYDMMNGASAEDMWGFESDTSEARMILDVMYEQPEAFYLLLFRSTGTPYESFFHDLLEQNTDQMMEFMESTKQQGYPVREIPRDEMHMLVTAYGTALIQPIEHHYSKADAERYLRTVLDFFTPGWRMITGL